jgi:hypothetical protein
MRGLYSGYTVTFRDGNKTVKLDVREGVRGINIPVAVSKKEDGSYGATFCGRPLTVIQTWESSWVKK